MNDSAPIRCYENSDVAGVLQTLLVSLAQCSIHVSFQFVKIIWSYLSLEGSDQFIGNNLTICMAKKLWITPLVSNGHRIFFLVCLCLTFDNSWPTTTTPAVFKSNLVKTKKFIFSMIFQVQITFLIIEFSSYHNCNNFSVIERCCRCGRCP